MAIGSIVHGANKTTRSKQECCSSSFLNERDTDTGSIVHGSEQTQMLLEQRSVGRYIISYTVLTRQIRDLRVCVLIKSNPTRAISCARLSGISRYRFELLWQTAIETDTAQNFYFLTCFFLIFKYKIISVMLSHYLQSFG
jgi:hypothetical protein